MARIIRPFFHREGRTLCRAKNFSSQQGREVSPSSSKLNAAQSAWMETARYFGKRGPLDCPRQQRKKALTREAGYWWFAGRFPNCRRPQAVRKTTRSLSMTKMIRSQVVLAVAVSLASAVGFAQGDGAATYKSKCAMCHGAAGTPSAGMAKMGIKPASDPAMQKLTAAEVATTVKSGKGKMHPVAGLTDAQIKEVSAFFKTLK
jgi:mono/diheme cytochrome c family protein